MSTEDARQAIEARAAANWTTTPIRFENVPFQESAAPYMALFILDGDGVQISLGTPAVRRWSGVILMQIFVQPDSGTKLARTYADSLGAIFDGQQFSAGDSGTIRTGIPSIRPIGIQHGWYQVNVTIPFIRDKQY